MTSLVLPSKHLSDTGPNAGNRGMILDNALVKLNAGMDRCSVYFEQQASDQEYMDACILMQAQLSAGAFSRFSIRGIVGAGFDEQNIVSCLQNQGGVIEINKLPLDAARNFLWVSRNSAERSLSPQELDEFVAALQSKVSPEPTTATAFENEADKLCEIANKNKFRIVCNDPTGEFGKNRIDPKVYSSLMRGYFYAAQEDCLKYLKGTGYSTSWHYLFGLVDQDNNQLGTYMLAQWPWGIEGSYTILRKDAPRNASCAPILMLFANALVMDKHRDEMLYGESNKWNTTPAMQGGFHDLLPPSQSHNRVNNIVIADNPIRLGELDASEPDLIPPPHTVAPYVSYGVVRGRNDLFTRGIVAQAQKILAI